MDEVPGDAGGQPGVGAIAYSVKNHWLKRSLPRTLYSIEGLKYLG